MIPNNLQINSFYFKLFGPFALNSFNLFLGLAILIFLYFSSKDNNIKKLISKKLYLDLITYSVLYGIVVARIVFIITEYRNIESLKEIFYVWDGGLSSIGGFLGAIIFIILFCNKHNINLLKLSNAAVIYLPLLHMIGRFGCLFMGCCFGSKTNVLWAIVYENSNFAPIGVKLHPAQIYSSIFWFFGYIFLKYFISKNQNLSKYATFIYILLFAIERFFIDFFRSDVGIFINLLGYSLGIYQIACLIIISLLLLIVLLQ